MKKFDFFIGQWTMIYTIPKSVLSPAKESGKGEGIFRKALNNKYVFFDYQAKLTSGTAQAHGIFTKDNNNPEFYNYWWFEDSGNQATAICKFINKNTLFMNWQNNTLIQTFETISPNQLLLTMSHPKDTQNFEAVLKVDFFRK